MAIGNDLLSYTYQSLHEWYTIVLASLIVVLLIGWKGLFNRLGKKDPLRGRVAAIRWGTLAWVVFLLILVTLPWRLVYDSTHERALLGGEQAYILMETEDELLLFRAESEITSRHSKGEIPGFQRLGTRGYIFEGPEFFEGGAGSDEPNRSQQGSEGGNEA